MNKKALLGKYSGTRPLEIIEYDDVTIHIYKHIVLVEIATGVTVSFANGFSVLLKVLKLIGRRPWVYISNRVNSYSLDPTGYKYINKIPNLKGFAVVNYHNSNNTTKLEATFCTKPFFVTEDLESAFIWADKMLKD